MIDIVRATKNAARIAAIPVCVGAIAFSTYNMFKPTVQPEAAENSEAAVVQVIVVQPTAEPSYTQGELDAMALTLAGECYDDKVQDKRLVCEVILNRVSNGNFGCSVIDVVSAKGQFNGYWVQSRAVSDSDYAVAAAALDDRYDNDCEALSEYLFFSAGDNRENEFREDFK